jgi:cation:H+ antiporter
MLEILGLVIGVLMLGLGSNKVVDHASILARNLGVPPVVLGIVFLAISTDLPEIITSITSFSIGHGVITTGDIMGSCLVQITLIAGVIALFGGGINGNRKQVLWWGVGAVVAELAAVLAISTGFITREIGILLIAAYVVITLLTCKFIGCKIPRPRKKTTDGILHTLLFVAIVIIGAFLTVESAIIISRNLGVPEFIVGFFAISIGTSLPELTIEFVAVLKKKYGLAVGDLLGSCIVDSTLALGIGPLLFPGSVAGASVGLGFYTIIATAIVVGLFALRKRINETTGLLGIILYLLAFLFLL